MERLCLYSGCIGRNRLGHHAFTGPPDTTIDLGGFDLGCMGGDGHTTHTSPVGCCGRLPLSLCSVYWLFKLFTGKEGMGYGDFKLFAALGAWFGWSALIPLILLASLAGIGVGLVLKYRQQLRENHYIPFGPFLAMAAWVYMIWGHLSVFNWLV